MNRDKIRTKVNTRIEALDGLRFLACMMVILYHYFFASPLSGFIPQNYAIYAFYFGDFGVDIFFLISGFVISLSSEEKSSFTFMKSRINRILPTFVIFGFIIYTFSISLPLVDPFERIISLFYSFTFFPQAFGHHLFSSVYWTIQSEVTFYILIFFMMQLGLWVRYKNQICFIWIIISFFNQFFLNSTIINYVLLTQYAGHFVAGIIIFKIRKNKCEPLDIILILFSIILIYNRMVYFNNTDAINLFHYQVTNTALLLSAVCVVSLVWYAANLNRVGKYYQIVKFLGAMTYPLYLIHSDIGFWSHAIFERLLWDKFPFTKIIIGYGMTIFIAFIISFFISAVYIKFFNKPVNILFKKIWMLNK